MNLLKEGLEQKVVISNQTDKRLVIDNISKLDISNKDSYNNIIHEFITESNRDAIKKTQTNIKLVGQQESGVVLSDGRIIDGNRRFTCLRNIQKETGKT